MGYAGRGQHGSRVLRKIELEATKRISPALLKLIPWTLSLFLIEKLYKYL